MKKLAFSLLLLLSLPAEASAWGLVTHRWVNERAIETLPDPLRAYLRLRQRELSNLAVEPDTVLRKRDGRKEGVKHFIDLDLYGAPPFGQVPPSRKEAYRRYGERTVKDRGTVPWTILDLHRRLVGELRAGRWDRAVEIGGHAGHYLADSTMPLHTTENHDGQLTGQKGIHKAVEHGLVDPRIDEYEKRAEPKIKPAAPDPFRWTVVMAILCESYDAVAPLLAADRSAREAGTFESDRYFTKLDVEARGLLASRLARAASAVGSFWLSAWVEAGRPDPPGTLLHKPRSPD